MQSSGVGNCINAIASISRACQFPLLLLVTMRGEWNEGNPWQVPMGRATQAVLEALGVQVVRVDAAADVEPSVAAMAGMAFTAEVQTAVLLSQRLIGAKAFR
jgi:sulfopyruvate decarboxylase TPP-binding subunit